MENNRQQPSESEQLQEQNNNPEKLSITDEEQRTKGRDADGGKQKTPVGNEKNKQDTDGAQAGVGE